MIKDPAPPIEQAVAPGSTMGSETLSQADSRGNTSQENTRASIETLPSPSRTLWLDGLWRQNPGLVTLLGLCPLLAISNTTINAAGLGLATLVTLLITNVLSSALRHQIPGPVRLPVHVLIIATTVTVIEQVLHAWFTELHAALGIFLPLIVTNCLILGRAQAFASRQPVALAVVDGLATGLGFLLVLLTLGAARELIGQGSVLADAHRLFGESARGWTMQLFAAEHGLLLALLPPGAFFALGLLLALYRLIRSSGPA